MTEYAITLPKQSIVHKPNLHGDTANFIGDNMELALKSFDTDGKKGLSSDELYQAFDYFVNKEKEIAVIGKKGDGVITSKDIEYIIKNDSKFNAIREALKDDNAVIDFLSNVVMSLCNLVSMKEKYPVNKINSRALAFDDNKYRYCEMRAERNVTNTQTNIKIVDGKKVQICTNNKGETYVKSGNGKYIYTTPAYVAKCLDYETESTWFGKDKYFTSHSEPCGSMASETYKQYKVWNNETHSFTNGEYKSTGKVYRSIGAP